MKSIVLSLVLAGLTAFAAGCGASDAVEDDVSDARTDDMTAEQSARIEKVTLDQSKPATDLSYSESMTSCELKGHYLKVSGLASTAATKAINDALTPDPLKELQAGCEQAFDINTSDEAIFNARGILSVEHVEDSYYAGAAHPNSGLWVASYSLKTGKKLEIADVFADASGKQLAHEVIATLEASDNEEHRGLAEMFKESILEHPEWMTFALTQESVRIYLTSYVPHAAFAMAVEPVELRYSDLRDALSGASEAAGVWAGAE